MLTSCYRVRDIHKDHEKPPAGFFSDLSALSARLLSLEGLLNELKGRYHLFYSSICRKKAYARLEGTNQTSRISQPIVSSSQKQRKAKNLGHNLCVQNLCQ